MIDKLIVELLEDIAERLNFNDKRIKLLMEKQIETLKLMDKMADAFTELQTQYEILNKAMLNFIPEKDRRGNQLIQ